MRQSSLRWSNDVLPFREKYSLQLESKDLRIFRISKVVPFYSTTDKLLTLKNGFDGRQRGHFRHRPRAADFCFIQHTLPGACILKRLVRNSSSSQGNWEMRRSSTWRNAWDTIHGEQQHLGDLRQLLSRLPVAVEGTTQNRSSAPCRKVRMPHYLSSL